MAACEQTSYRVALVWKRVTLQRGRAMGGATTRYDIGEEETHGQWEDDSPPTRTLFQSADDAKDRAIELILDLSGRDVMVSGDMQRATLCTAEVRRTDDEATVLALDATSLLTDDHGKRSRVTLVHRERESIPCP